MDLTALLKEIGRPCTTLEAGGFRPTYALEESWLGKVSLYAEEEGIPIDKHGKPMAPLGQFYLPAFPFVPPQLVGVTLLTAFISLEFTGDAEEMERCWEIREYADPYKLVSKDFPPDPNHLKPFPLRPNLVPADYPIWDGGGLTPEEEDAFLELEEEGEIEGYSEVAENKEVHKFGGYPSFCQSGVDLYPHEFVFQVATDNKILLNVVDGGILTFWKNPNDGTWKLYYDFY